MAGPRSANSWLYAELQDSGRASLGPAADTVLQASSCGAADLRALVLSVTDADRPFSSPAQFPQPVRAPQAPGRESPGYEPVNPH